MIKGGIFILLAENIIDKKVLIVMPCFNEELYISMSIDSILNQSYPFLELHIFDNASIDSTISIICDFQSRDSRVYLHKSEINVGIINNFAKCYNFALNSDFEFFLLLQADDYFDTSYLKLLFDGLRDNPLSSVSYGNLVTIDKNEKPIRNYPHFSRYNLNNRYLRLMNYIIEPETLGKCNMFLGLVRINDFKKIYNHDILTHLAFDYVIAYRLVNLNPAVIVTNTTHYKRSGDLDVEDLFFINSTIKDYIFGHVKRIDFLYYLSRNYFISIDGFLDFFVITSLVISKWIISYSIFLITMPLIIVYRILKSCLAKTKTI